MKKSGLLFRALVFSALMVVNGQSAVLYGSRPSSELCRPRIFNQKELDILIDDGAIECNPGTWIGAISTEWNLAENWCNGNVPTSTTDVTISTGGYQPVINSEAYCNNLTILLGAKLTISDSNRLTVSGNFVNNGTFNRNQSTVIFNGGNQQVGKGPYYNLTFKGDGIKTVANIGEAFYYGLLSMEEMATVSGIPYQAPTSRLQYNTVSPKTVGPEWTSPYTAGGITIKNTGVITLNTEKWLINSSGNKGSLTVEEDATLNLNMGIIHIPKAVNLKCGALKKGSSIIGTGTIYLDNTPINVTDAGHGTAGAIISCMVRFAGTSTLMVENDDPSQFIDDDLTIRMASNGGTLIKSGSGTLNLASNELNLFDFKLNEGHVTIPVDAQIRVDNITTITPVDGLTILSDASSTGSFIANTASGSASVIRYMSPRRWHIVSSPVSGQTVGQFLTINGNIPKNTASGAPTTAPFERGMRGYDPLNNQWGNFYKDGSTELMSKGKGFLIRVKSTGDQNITFTGPLNTGDISVTGLAAGLWNCIGNPYTSAIRINSETETYKFLGLNSTNLDPLYGAIYIWHQADAEATASGVYHESSGSYQTISNASFSFGDNPSAENEIQLGQAFMVKMATDKTSIVFKKAMQVHKSSLLLKSTSNVWPTIKLKATTDSMTSSTIIAFHEGMTPGLDPTYDAGLLKAGNEMSLYTILIEDTGIPFAIQALPTDYESIVVPLGIDGANDGKVIFSAEFLHVPSTCQAILEDRLNKTFTDLSISSYTADLKGSTSSQGRFFLHTSYSTTGMDSKERVQDLRAWAVNNQEMRISGTVGSKAKALLYDIQGRLILSVPLKADINHAIRLPDVKPGIYILQIEEQEYKHVLKLFIGK